MSRDRLEVNYQTLDDVRRLFDKDTRSQFDWLL